MLLLLAALPFSLLGSLVSLYCGLSAGVGPWLLPLLGILIFSILSGIFGRSADRERVMGLALASFAASAASTAVAFSFPILFFLDPVGWQLLLEVPFVFIGGLGFLIVSADVLGGLLVMWWQRDLLASDDQPAYPLAVMLKQTLDACFAGASQALFYYGAGAACVASMVLELFMVTGSLQLLAAASGFLAGASLALPLLIGAALKQGIQWWGVWQAGFEIDVAFGLGFGLLAYSFAQSTGRWLWQLLRSGLLGRSRPTLIGTFAASLLLAVALVGSGAAVRGVVAAVLFTGVGFLLLKQLALFVRRAGIAPYGRYITLALIPLVLFGYSGAWLLTVASTLVACTGASIVSHMLVAHVGMQRKYWLALCFNAAVCVPLVLYFLLVMFPLGDAPFTAHRCLARALLLQQPSLSWPLFGLGSFLAFVCHLCRVETSLVFGGLIMPLPLSMALAAGSAATRFFGPESARQQLGAGVLLGALTAFFIALLVF